MAKERVLNNDSNIGHARKELWASAKMHLKDAIADGYFIEAIALEESMILDRLESLIQALDGGGSATTLGRARSRLEKLNSALLPPALVKSLEEWNSARSEAIHQMVKLLEGYESDWSDRVAANRITAIVGRKLVNDVDKFVSKEIRSRRKVKTK